jgi:hypothetical protein
VVGLVLVLIWGVLAHFFWHASWEGVFLGGTNFLFWWYIVFSALIGIVVLIFAIILPILGACFGSGLSYKRPKSFGFLGAMAGGGLSIVMIGAFVIARGCLIYGIYLLHHALSPEGVWDKNQVIIGAIVFVVGLILNRGNSITFTSKSSSSSSLSTRRY